jgi:exopolyphosphatase / guanosine-5'-triphosphate,3'-diphosphate pyrophosphatase
MKAILDLGTNTFHLLIAQVTDSVIDTKVRLQIPVKIGEGGLADGHIQPAAFLRGLDALAQFRIVLNQYGIGETVAYGTSAIRDAKNGKDFIDEALNKFQIRIRAISGEQEADLIYAGVAQSFTLPNERICVMDIGGGSVEFCIGMGSEVLWKKSYPIGAARLLHQFQEVNQYPIDSNQIRLVQEFILKELNELKAALTIYPTTILVGSAGSFETLVDVLQLDFKEVLFPLGIAALEVSIPQFNRFYQAMLDLPINERSTLKGMVDFRVEMIVVASILMQTIISRFQFNRLIASQYALKEGLLFSQDL